jgi:hypothetical protein
MIAQQFVLSHIHTSVLCTRCNCYLTTSSHHDPNVCFTHRCMAGDAIKNIIMAHQLSFLRRVELSPNIHLIFAGDFGLKVLAESQQTIVDGTFDLCEKKLVLTTIIGLKDNIAIPGVYLLSNSRETDNYEDYYKVN